MIGGDVGDAKRSGAQNALNQNGSVKRLDGTGGILRFSQNGNEITGIIANDSIGRNYYAYGIRIGFGIDFDPLTGFLWDTENGPSYGDEINLVKPGFNSGWSNVQGIWKHTKDDFFPRKDNITYHPDNLVDFNGYGKYKSPEFTWNKAVGVTAIKFLNSDKLGKKYENDLFVGDINNGNLYHFDLNKKRNALSLHGALADKVADNSSEIKPIVLLTGLGGITDIQIGPDGYLYFSAIGKPYPQEQNSTSPDGAIYRLKAQGK